MPVGLFQFKVMSWPLIADLEAVSVGADGAFVSITIVVEEAVGEILLKLSTATRL